MAFSMAWMSSDDPGAFSGLQDAAFTVPQTDPRADQERERKLCEVAGDYMLWLGLPVLPMQVALYVQNHSPFYLQHRGGGRAQKRSGTAEKRSGTAGQPVSLAK